LPREYSPSQAILTEESLARSRKS